MDEAKSSWNTVYQSKEGFECQITLRDEDESVLSQRASVVIAGIAKSGGLPVKRKGSEVNNINSEKSGSDEETVPDKYEKTYIDEKGVRRCNLQRKDGTICGSPVTERDGRYGPFWSCPNYKEHAA